MRVGMSFEIVSKEDALMKDNEKKIDTEFLALVLINQLYVDKVINDATYKAITKKYIKDGDK